MQICFPCTGCGTPLLTDPVAANRQVQCPACGTAVAVPDPERAVLIAQPAEPAGAAAAPQTTTIKIIGQTAGLLAKKEPDPEQEPVLDVELEEIKEAKSLLKERIVMKVGSRPRAPEPSNDPPPLDAMEVLPDEPATAAPMSLEIAPTPRSEPPPLPAAYLASVMADVEILPEDSPGSQNGIMDRTGVSVTTLREGEYELPLLPEPPSVVAANDTPILEEDDDTQPDRKRKVSPQLREKHRALKATSTGLALIYWGILCFLLALLAGMCTLIATPFLEGAVARELHGAGGSAPPAGAAALLRLGSLLGLGLEVVAALLIWLGKFFCCWVPKKAETRTIITVSFCLDLAAVMLVLYSFLAVILASFVSRDLAQLGTSLALVAFALAMLLLVASLVLLFVFLRNFAYYLDEPGSGREATEILVVWLWLTVGGFLVLGFLVGLGMLAPVALLVVALAMPLFSIWWIITYIKQWIRLLHLIGSLRQVLASRYRL